MTEHGPLLLMRELEAEIARSGAQNIYEHTSGEWIIKFGQQLEAFEPFKTVATRWMVCGMGGGRTGVGVTGHWVWHQLLNGSNPQIILDSATAAVSANRYEAIEVRPVKGIKINLAYQLTPTASLVPNGQLVKGYAHARAFANDMLGPQFPTDTAALIQTMVVDPALTALDDRDTQSFQSSREQRDAYAARLRLALGLASEGPVEMPLVYGQGDPDCILGLSGEVLSQRPTTTHFGSDVDVDLPAALSIYAELEAMVAPDALELSVDRLLRSRLARSLEDRIIDLGMAAEIALMHSPKGVSDGKSEVTNKLANRGAWLVAETPDERREVANLLSELYSARSVVVHTGVASGKLQSRIAAFDAIVVKVARALLRRGGFPDWKSLVLGGDGKFPL